MADIIMRVKLLTDEAKREMRDLERQLASTRVGTPGGIGGGVASGIGGGLASGAIGGAVAAKLAKKQPVSQEDIIKDFESYSLTQKNLAATLGSRESGVANTVTYSSTIAGAATGAGEKTEGIFKKLGKRIGGSFVGAIAGVFTLDFIIRQIEGVFRKIEERKKDIQTTAETLSINKSSAEGLVSGMEQVGLKADDISKAFDILGKTIEKALVGKGEGAEKLRSYLEEIGITIDEVNRATTTEAKIDLFAKIASNAKDAKKAIELLGPEYEKYSKGLQLGKVSEEEVRKRFFSPQNAITYPTTFGPVTNYTKSMNQIRQELLQQGITSDLKSAFADKFISQPTVSVKSVGLGELFDRMYGQTQSDIQKQQLDVLKSIDAKTQPNNGQITPGA